MKREYKTPIAEIIEISTSEVITASGLEANADDLWGDWFNA